MKQPIATIMIPVHNSERFITQTLESAVNQTFRGSYEILVVNDGSTDNTLRILEYYSSKFSFVKFLSQENKGTSSARNVLLENARGDFLFGLDADDVLDKRALEVVLRTYKHFPEANHIYTDQREIDEKGNFLWDRKRSRVHQFMKDLAYHCHFQGHLKSFKRGLIKNKRFDENLRSAVDWDFFLKVFPRAKIIHIPEILYSYRINKKGISISRREEVIRNSISLIEKYLKERRIYKNKDFKVTPVNVRENIHYYDHIVNGKSTMPQHLREVLESYLTNGE